MKILLSCIFISLYINFNSAHAQTSNDSIIPPPPVVNIDLEKVYNAVEKMPAFPGGEEALFKYLGTNIKYPKKARRENISGTIYATFVITYEGKVTNVSILRGLGYGCDEEVLRVIRSMPNWTPGETGGRKVNVQYNLPLKFNLTDRK